MEVTAAELAAAVRQLPDPNTTQTSVCEVAPHRAFREPDSSAPVSETAHLETIRFHKVQMASRHGRWFEWAINIETN